MLILFFILIVLLFSLLWLQECSHHLLVCWKDQYQFQMVLITGHPWHPVYYSLFQHSLPTTRKCMCCTVYELCIDGCIFCSMLQSFVATVMARSLTAHMIHLIIPAVKEHVPISSLISAVMETNQKTHTLDTLYCPLCNVEGRIGMYYMCVYNVCQWCYIVICVCVMINQGLI